MDAATLRPMLAVPGRRDELGTGFAAELKWDGVRALVHTDGERIAVRARSGNDITSRYPELAGLGGALGRRAILDGEVVAFDERSRPSFARLQRRMHVADPHKVAALAREVPVAFIAFDLLLDGDEMVLDQPYEQRRERLAALNLADRHWQTPPGADDVEQLLTVATDLELEGVVAKRLGSRYQPGRRSPDWRKIRLMRRQELVVGGYRPGRGARSSTFASLLVGYHDESGALRYAGGVGTGYTDRVLADLHARLAGLTRGTSPFADRVPHRDAVFCEPRLVVEVEFAEWTPDGVLRAPSYKGLRDDKDPREVVREPPGSP